MFNFEKLDVWQKAIDFADLIYTNTLGSPADERFGLTTQLRRGAVSIARFVEIAGDSVFEVVSQSFIARRQSFLSDSDFRRIYAAAEEQSRMLSGLRRSLLAVE
jgi:hypothetical protein